MRRFVFLFLVVLLTSCAEPYEIAGKVLSKPYPVPDIELMSANGPVSLHDFDGQYVLVFFGYTFCPDACPITLSILKRVMEQMPNQADRFQVVMITVDPERDTPERLADYMGYFDPRFVGLSGSLADIDAVAYALGARYERQEGSAATGYLVGHTTRTFLVDPNHNAIITYVHGFDDEAIVADLKYLLKKRS